MGKSSRQANKGNSNRFFYRAYRELAVAAEVIHRYASRCIGTKQKRHTQSRSIEQFILFAAGNVATEFLELYKNRKYSDAVLCGMIRLSSLDMSN